MKILYASYQTGGVLPGYVKYALLRLAKLGSVTLLTNERVLEHSELKLLEQNGIELFMTENRGFDFGMWRRYLERFDIQDSRLVVLNDSVVYFRDCFKDFFDRAEKSSADAVSLTANNEVLPHLQSFFLYLKDDAVKTFCEHLLNTSEQLNFYGVVRNLEIPFLKKLQDAGMSGEALFPTKTDALFCFPELIAGGCGFIKRKLLQRRFGFMEQQHFAKAGYARVLFADYHKLIASVGMDPEFFPDWLPLPTDSCIRFVKMFIWMFYGLCFRCFKKF